MDCTAKTSSDLRRRNSRQGGDLMKVSWGHVEDPGTPAHPRDDFDWGPDLEKRKSEPASPWAGKAAASTLSEHTSRTQMTQNTVSSTATVNTVNVKMFPKDLQAIVEVYSKHGSQEVDAHELAMALMDMSTKKASAEKETFKRMLIFSLVLILIMAASIFGLSVVSAEFAKDITASGTDSVLRTVQGDIVKVYSADFQVSPSGELVSRNGTEDAADGSNVATQQTRKRQALHSALPDSFFEALDELTVYSSMGNQVTLAIHGFARVPVLHSRCGNVVHLFTAWGSRVTLDSDTLSLDSDLGSLFENAGFEIAVGGVGGRRLSSVWGVSGLFQHIQAKEDEQSWTCKDVPLPAVAPHYLAKVTVYRPCSFQTSTSSSNCDSKFGGSLAGVAELPAEHRDAALNSLQRVQTSLGIENGQEGRRYYSYNFTVVSSSSYRAQVTHLPSHPLQDHFNIINTAEATGVDFQWLKVPGISERFYCKAVQNVTETPAYKSAMDHQAGLDPNNQFEFVGLDSFGDVVYRHFRYIFDFPLWANASAGAPAADQVIHLWDNAETLELHRILLPSGFMMVFDSYTANVSDSTAQEALQDLLRGRVSLPSQQRRLSSSGSSTDEEEDPSSGLIVDESAADENDFNGALWDSLATAACHENEADGVSDVAGLMPEGRKVPVIGSSFHDFGLDDASFYAELLEDDESLGDHADGWLSLRQVPEGDALHSFADYALRVHDGALATADVCRSACEATVAGVFSHVNVEGGVVCTAPGLSQMMQCMAGLPTTLSKFCELTPLVSKAAGCVQQQARRRLKSQAEVMPDGTHRVDLSTVSWRARADLSKELGMDLLSRQAFLYANGTDAGSVVAETTSIAGVSHSRRLRASSCTQEDPTPGAYCYRFLYPSSCSGHSCLLSFQVQVQPFGEYKALTLNLNGEADLFSTFFPGGDKIPVYGRVGGRGDIRVNNQASCPDIIPFDLIGNASAYAQIGADIPVVGEIDLAKLDLRLETKNIIVEAYTAKKRTDARRRWGGWSRRRRAEWTTEEFEKQCDIQVVGETCLTVAVLKGCLEGSYAVHTGRFILAVKTYWYNPIPFMQSWNEIWTGNVIDTAPPA